MIIFPIQILPGGGRKPNLKKIKKLVMPGLTKLLSDTYSAGKKTLAELRKEK